MISHTRAVTPTGVTVVLLLLSIFARSQALFKGLVSSARFTICRRHVLALFVVDVSADFEVEIRFACASCAICACMRLAGSDRAVWSRLKGLEAAGGVGRDTEVACEGRSDVGGTSVWVDLEIKSACDPGEP